MASEECALLKGMTKNMRRQAYVVAGGGGSDEYSTYFAVNLRAIPTMLSMIPSVLTGVRERDLETINIMVART